MKEREIVASDLQRSGYIHTASDPSGAADYNGMTGCLNRSLYRPGGLRITINVLRKYNIEMAAIQETMWNKLTSQAVTSHGYNIYNANNHEFGTAFLVDSKFNHMVKNFTPINKRLCVIRIKGRFFNYYSTNDSEEEAKDQFYEQLERACPSHDVKFGDARRKCKSWPGNRTSAFSQR
jgi:hypothetical protein